jgi:ATP-dependent RNA helicase RhlE
LPNIAESYVHRIGRTARAGAEGIAISFCDHEEMAYLRDIERLIQFKIESSDRRKDPNARPASAPKQHRGGHNRNHHGKGRHENRNGGHRHGHNGERHGHGHGNANAHGGHGNGQKNKGQRHQQNEQRPREGQNSGGGEGVGGVAFLNRKGDHRRNHGHGGHQHGRHRPAS